MEGTRPCATASAARFASSVENMNIRLGGGSKLVGNMAFFLCFGLLGPSELSESAVKITF